MVILAYNSFFQISEQKGFRSELHEILEKYGKDYKSKY
ncbi:hypothetical protein BOVAB4_4378 [Bacteroides ovatus]|nr:hypothetical protein BOVAB4_4378 [Bacteroides ovatus]